MLSLTNSYVTSSHVYILPDGSSGKWRLLGMSRGVIRSHLLIALLIVTLTTGALKAQSGQESGLFSYIIYRGAYHLDISGDELISQYINVNETQCESPLESLSINIDYYVEVNISSSREGLVKHVVFKIVNFVVSKSCVLDSFREKEAVFNITVVNPSEWPIVLHLSQGSFTPIDINFSGEVVGFVRFATYDAIHKVVVESEEEAYRYSYVRADLYYEPFTNTPVHYVLIRLERQRAGAITEYAYVAMEESQGLLTERVQRAVYNIHVARRGGVNETVILIVLYTPESVERGDSSELKLSAERNALFLEFNEKVKCFLQLGVIKGDVLSNIALAHYYVGDGRVYYTPSPIRCETVYMEFRDLEILGVVAEKSFPEKLPPPYRPRSVANDLLVGLIVITPILVFFAQVSRYLARKITRTDDGALNAY
jgi:hypothetical protein